LHGEEEVLGHSLRLKKEWFHLREKGEQRKQRQKKKEK
jgi:hypothetical protein